MAMQNMLALPAVVLGLFLLLPYGAGTRLGAILFKPELEKFYRVVAYGIIFLAILLGLPVWD